MSTSAKRLRRSRQEQVPPPWPQFLALAPRIKQHARIAFRGLDPEARAEAEQEVLCNALVAFVRLHQLGRTNLAYASPLANHSVLQVRDGRHVGGHLNSREVLERRAQRLKHFHVESLDRFDPDEGWIEAVVEDPHTPVFDQVWFRLDFPAWLKTLTARDRKIALKLASGEKPGRVAHIFGITPGRVAQLRREFYEKWNRFHGEDTAPATASMPA
jgi:hypothetical protein